MGDLPSSRREALRRQFICCRAHIGRHGIQNAALCRAWGMLIYRQHALAIGVRELKSKAFIRRVICLRRQREISVLYASIAREWGQLK